MSLINPDLSGIVDGAVGDAADWTTPMNTIINTINGGLDNSNFSLSGTPLAQQLIATSTLGYTQLTSNVVLGSAVGGDQDVTAFTVTVTVPSGGRRCRITAYAPFMNSDGAAGTGMQLKIKESTTVLQQAEYKQAGVSYSIPINCQYCSVLTAGAHTYKVAVQTTAGNVTVGAGATEPAFILVELI